MSQGTDVITHEPLRAAAVEALALLGELARLTASAADALEREGADAPLSLLEQRAAVLSRLEPLLRRLTTRRQGGRGRGSPDLASLLAEVQRAGASLRASEIALAGRMAARRDEIAAELEQMGSATAANTAYGRGPERRRLDLVR